jgi:hypothetical protein
LFCKFYPSVQARGIGNILVIYQCNHQQGWDFCNFYPNARTRGTGHASVKHQYNNQQGWCFVISVPVYRPGVQVIHQPFTSATTSRTGVFVISTLM